MMSPVWGSLRCAPSGAPGNLRPLFPSVSLGGPLCLGGMEPCGGGEGASSIPALAHLPKRVASSHRPGKQSRVLSSANTARAVSARPTFGKGPGTSRKKVLLFPRQPQTSSKVAAERVSLPGSPAFQGPSMLSFPDSPDGCGRGCHRPLCLPVSICQTSAGSVLRTNSCYSATSE